MIKRSLSLLLSLAVLVGCFIVNSQSTAASAVGAGGGIDETVETAKELSELLSFVAERDSTGLASTYSRLASATEAESTDTDTTEDNGDDVGDSKYSSASIHLSTQLTSESNSSNSEYSNGLISSKQSVNRQLSIYITEESTYYASKGVYSLVQRRNNGTGSAFMDFDVEIALIGGNAYIMFHDFLYIENGVSRRIKPTRADQWIKGCDSFVSAFLYTDNENRQVLKSIGEMIDYLGENGIIDRVSGITTLYKEDFNEISQKEDGEDMLDEDQELKFTIDMSSPANPYIYSVATTDSVDNTVITTGYDYTTLTPITTTVTIKNKVNNVQEISICNINNTAISFDEDAVSIVLDEEDYEGEDIFIIKEEEADD